jgi:hypothetical protein
MHFAQAAQHGLQPGRFGHGDAADVEIVHRRGNALQPRIGFQAEARGHHFEADARADVAEARAVVIEADGAARRTDRGAGVVQPDELGRRVDEAPHQPGAGQPVHPRARAGGPALALEPGSIEPRDAVVRARLRFAFGEPGVERAPQRQQLGLGLFGGRAGVVVDAAQGLQRVGHAAQPAPGLGFGQSFELELQRGRGLAPLRIGLGAIELRQHFRALGLVARRERHHRRRSAVLAHLCSQGLQGRRVRLGQQVGAVAQRCASQRLERPPDAQAHRVRLGRKSDDQDGPHDE